MAIPGDRADPERGIEQTVRHATLAVKIWSPTNERQTALDAARYCGRVLRPSLALRLEGVTKSNRLRQKSPKLRQLRRLRLTIEQKGKHS